jgi:hypothetical protein
MGKKTSTALNAAKIIIALFVTIGSLPSIITGSGFPASQLMFLTASGYLTYKLVNKVSEKEEK